jgi:hypothetical protein
MNAYTAFADTPQLRQKIVETIMGDGKTTNAHALDIFARLYSAGFEIIPYRDKLTDAIAQNGQIPHMTQRP